METLTMDDLVRLAVVIAGIWGFCKIVGEIVRTINARHDREQAWDDTATKLRKEREEDVCQYDAKLSEIRKSQDEIRTDFECKVQQIRSEQLLIVECIRAVLDGLHQQGCNGEVSKALSKLDSYMITRAHEG